MNDDLHHIDDLFRKELEEYNELPPPSVWEEVNNDLDRKQNSLYQSKYNRLKRVSLFLLLLCFMATTYIIFDVAKNHPTLAEQKKQQAAKPLPDNPKENKTERINESKSLPNKRQGGKINDAVTDTASSVRLQHSTGEKNKKNADTLIMNLPANQLQTEKKNKTMSDAVRSERALNQPSLLFHLPLVDEKGEAGFFTGDSVANQGKNQRSEPPFFTHRLPLLASDLQLVFPEHKGDSIKFITDLNTLSAHHTSLNLPTNTASAIRIKPKTTPRFSLSFFAAPGFSLNESNNDHHDGGRPDNDRDKEEQNPVFFSSGVLMNYSFTDKWSLESGVSVMTSSTSVKSKTVYAKADNDGHVRYELNYSSGVTYIPSKNNVPLSVGDSAITSGSTSRLVYVTVPLSLSYRIGTGRFSFVPTLGVGLNVLVNGKIKTGFSNNESTTTSIEGLKRNFLNGHIGIGIEYGLTRKLSIGVRPNAMLSLAPINKETPVKSYQNYMGIEAAVRVKL